MSASRSPDVRVSFVVLSHNSTQYLRKCIRSLRLQAGPSARDEIWVVDNGSTDGSPEVLESLQAEPGSPLHVINLSQNYGTTVPRNLVLRRAAGRFVAIVDSDVEIPPGAVDALIAALEADPACGILAPALVHPDGRFQLSTDVFPTLPRKLARLVGLRVLERLAPDRPAGGAVTDVDYAISAFWLMPRATLDRVGLLDENIFYSPEDVDYCIRVWESGLRVKCDSRVTVVHDAQEISRRLIPRRASFSHAWGLVYLFRTHGFCLSLTRLHRRIGRWRAPEAASGRGHLAGRLAS